MPLNNKNGDLPSTRDRGEGRGKKKKKSAVALALLSLKDKGESRCFDVMNYGKGCRGVLGRVSWKNWQIPKRAKEMDES
jgi:hypothetical protein